MAADSDGEMNQHARNGALKNAILTGDAMSIRSILKIRSADSPLNSPIGLLGNAHSQHLPTLPIHLAAIYRKVQSLEALLHCGADPERRDSHGRTALHLVLTHWPRTDMSCSRPGGRFQAKMAAAEERAKACLRLLCDSGADANAQVEGDTPLHLAVRAGARGAVSILVGRGALVEAADRLGLLPLHVAAAAGDSRTAAALVRHGARADGPLGRAGSSALHMAVVAAAGVRGPAGTGALACLRVLLAGGARPDVRDAAGRTPLHQACQDGLEEAADALLARGADANARTALGQNCLFLFLERVANLGRASLLGKLLRLTCPLSVADGLGGLPAALQLPQHGAQRDRLLQLCRQPPSLQDACRARIRRQCGEERATLALGALLPRKLLRFVYGGWDCPAGISFAGERRSGDGEAPGGLPATAGDVNTADARPSVGEI